MTIQRCKGCPPAPADLCEGCTWLVRYTEQGWPRVPLEVGDLAWCIIGRPLGRRGERQEVVGGAQVKVVSIDGATFTVEVVAGSGGVIEGHRHELPRAQLWAKADRGEHLAFGSQVSRWWG